jgi:hypothetical protein
MGEDLDEAHAPARVQDGHDFPDAGNAKAAPAKAKAKKAAK